jgi:hypothetical protein
MLLAAMRRSLALLMLLLPAACSDQYEPPLSYGRCFANEVCGLATRCEQLTASNTGAPALLCTQACAVDRDCPGISVVCARGVAVASDAGVAEAGLSGRCLRACSVDVDCRPGTVCRALTPDAGADRVCVANLSM